MALPLWGELEKAQDSDQTIAEYVAQEIAAHEADSEAHLGEGESLEQHKTEGMIDHPAGSIATDKISNERVLITAFESLDGWASLGTIIHDFGSVIIRTGTTSGNGAILYAVPTSWIGLDWDKSFFWKSTVRVPVDTSQTIYIGVGGSDYLGGFSGAGFRIINSTLVAYHAVDSGGGFTYTTSSSIAVDVTEYHAYEIRYSVSLGTLEFYIDGSLVASFDSSLPTSDSDEFAIFQVHTNTNAARNIYVNDLLYQVAR